VHRDDKRSHYCHTPRIGHILAAKHENSTADTRMLEAEIDQLVYALYGLTEDEIQIVEGTKT
jgi:hypothetical protein